MPWKSHNHLSVRKPATARAECKEDMVGRISGGNRANQHLGVERTSGELRCHEGQDRLHPVAAHDG